MRVYLVARLLAVAFSFCTLWLTWVIGRRYFSAPAALLGVSLLACMPGAVQQAHFFLVDGPFLLCGTAALYAILRALEAERRWPYVAAGLLIGLTAAARLNGALLGLLLLTGAALRAWSAESDWRALRNRLADGRLWMAAGVAALTLALFEPYLLADPARLWRTASVLDFGMSLKVATGEMLQPWTLVDIHTVPYLHHWTHLMPRLAGWPATALFLVGLVYGMARRSPARDLLLLWCGAYFLQVGGLHAKHVRYLVPLLPPLALFSGAVLCNLIEQTVAWKRRLGIALTVFTAGYALVYGLAFARIYTIEDSRIQAGRWLAAQAVAGSRIGLERGGFSLTALVSGERYEKSTLGLSKVYAAGAYLTCGLRREFLGRRLQQFDYLAVTDVNRYRQFTAVPELFPVLADFYDRLLDGRLGFEPVNRFKTYPQWLGVRFADDDAEPSFISYDHPAVVILKRKAAGAMNGDLAAWAQSTTRGCADGALQDLAGHLKGGRLMEAQALADQIERSFAASKLNYLMEAEVHRRRGSASMAAQARQRFFDPYYEGSLASQFVGPASEHHIPGAAALSLAHLGLPDLALEALRQARQPDSYDEAQRRSLAHDVSVVAQHLFEKQLPAHATEAARLALAIHPEPGVYNMMGKHAYLAGDYARALANWQQALRLSDETGARDRLKAEIHWQIGTVSMEKTGDYTAAIHHFQQAIQLDPQRFAPLVEQIESLRTRVQ